MKCSAKIFESLVQSIWSQCIHLKYKHLTADWVSERKYCLCLPKKYLNHLTIHPDSNEFEDFEISYSFSLHVILHRSNNVGDLRLQSLAIRMWISFDWVIGRTRWSLYARSINSVDNRTHMHVSQSHAGSKTRGAYVPLDFSKGMGGCKVLISFQMSFWQSFVWDFQFSLIK